MNSSHISSRNNLFLYAVIPSLNPVPHFCISPTFHSQSVQLFSFPLILVHSFSQLFKKYVILKRKFLPKSIVYNWKIIVGQVKKWRILNGATDREWVIGNALKYLVFVSIFIYFTRHWRSIRITALYSVK